VTSTDGPLQRKYQQALRDLDLQSDPRQLAVLQHFERLSRELQDATGESALARFAARLLRGTTRAPTIRGIYLWGGVGRGKTWLMDLFFDALTTKQKKRLHFHRFMQSVHEGLRRHRDRTDPLAEVATDWAAATRVICFDELFVNDIADAMLIAGLFEHLLQRGVTLVFTSNVPPSGLYRDGLQRQRFLPAIALIETHCEIVNLNGDIDYRLRRLTQRPIYLASTDPTSESTLATLFTELSDTPIPTDHIDVEGRRIAVKRLADSVVWFEFQALCDGPRSQNDYLSIAHEFHTVLISHVPVFTSSMENAARRFIAAVDEFYDRRVNLVVSAAAAPTELYRGEKLRFEFERTTSRLIEMQSESYLASEHRLN
jgi:cell division protein ZapE